MVRVCGVRGEGKGEGRRGGREGDGEWKAGGWKREVEDRWAVVVGLVAWEVERWGGDVVLRGESRYCTRDAALYMYVCRVHTVCTGA